MGYPLKYQAHVSLQILSPSRKLLDRKCLIFDRLIELSTIVRLIFVLWFRRFTLFDLTDLLSETVKVNFGASLLMGNLYFWFSMFSRRCDAPLLHPNAAMS